LRQQLSFAQTDKEKLQQTLSLTEQQQKTLNNKLEESRRVIQELENSSNQLSKDLKEANEEKAVSISLKLFTDLLIHVTTTLFR